MVRRPPLIFHILVTSLGVGTPTQTSLKSHKPVDSCFAHLSTLFHVIQNMQHDEMEIIRVTFYSSIRRNQGFFVIKVNLFVAHYQNPEIKQDNYFFQRLSASICCLKVYCHSKVPKVDLIFQILDHSVETCKVNSTYSA